jgi:sulfatase modifying factor 1
MKQLCIIFIFVVTLSVTSTHAEISDMKWFADQAKLLNNDASWKFFSRDAERNIEFYYDEKHVTVASKDSKIVRLKNAYNGQRAITELIRERERELKMRSRDAVSSLKYEGFAFSIETAEVSCSQARIGTESIAYDFDKNGNVLNIVPKIRGSFQILANSPGESLYNIICKDKMIAQKTNSDDVSNQAALNASPSNYTDAFTGMEFIFVKGGCFMRNAAVNSSAQKTLEYKVCVDNYYIGKYKVTQDQWKKVMGTEPIHSVQCRGNCPAVFISWEMTEEYIKKINGQTHLNYRLPTEAEWEYAAKARGTSQKYAGANEESELPDYAWYNVNSKGQIHPVGLKKPNGLGLYDMSGNVWEWIGDWYAAEYYQNSPTNNPTGPANGDQRVVRGGNYECSEAGIRTTWRAGVPPGRRDNGTGFRLALPAVKN